MICLWLLVCSVFLYFSSNLLLALLVLELMGFLIIFFVSFFLSGFLLIDSLVILLFCIFVIEGVIGLSGLISLVSFSGSDYLSSSSFSRC